MPSVRGDSGLYGKLWRHHGWHTQHGGHVPSLVIVAPDAPREALFGFCVANHVEDLNVALPRDFASENLFDRHRGRMRGIAAVDGFDRLAQFGKVVAHGRESATKSSTFHKREETPSAMAGVQRMEECVFTKL